jgi:hypothetical protein
LPGTMMPGLTPSPGTVMPYFGRPGTAWIGNVHVWLQVICAFKFLYTRIVTMCVCA